MERARNRAADIRKYSFEYRDGDWGKDVKMRLIRVRATNPKMRTIELGILSDDRNRPAQELIYLMFNRWLQENDFKYLEKHFGINQITSYASISYEQLGCLEVDRPPLVLRHAPTLQSSVRQLPR